MAFWDRILGRETKVKKKKRKTTKRKTPVNRTTASRQNSKPRTQTQSKPTNKTSQVVSDTKQVALLEQVSAQLQEKTSDPLQDLLNTSKLVTSLSKELQAIGFDVRTILVEGAKEQTLKEGIEKIITRQELEDVLEKYILRNALSAPTVSDTKVDIQDTTKIKEKVKAVARDVEDYARFIDAKNKVIESLDSFGPQKFGNENGDYGLTKTTKLSRSYIYKVCYTGLDGRGSTEEPAEDTLLHQGRIFLKKTGRAFEVELNE